MESCADGVNLHPGPFGFLRKHLAGDYGLPRTYWLHLYLGATAFEACSSGLLETVFAEAPARSTSALAILIILCWYPFWAFLACGAWASAGKHAARGGATGWAHAARAAILLGVVVQLFSVPESVRNLRDHWEQTRGEQPGPAPSFHLARDGATLIVSGGINDGIAAQLETALARSPRVTTLVLSSHGGWTYEGRKLGRLIAARGLNTHVETECSSACTLAYLAGRRRTAGPAARLGFHTFGPGDRKAAAVAVRKAYGRLGMREDFVRQVNATAPDNMWYPDAAALLRYGVLTRAQGEAVPVLAGPFRQL